MTICLCFDSTLQHYYSHVINSIKVHTNELCKFYFLCDNTVNIRTNIEIIRMTDSVDVIPHGNVKSIAQYYRIYIPELIPDDKVLYFDNDVILNVDIKELSNIDVTDYYWAGVRDPLNATIRETQQFQGFITGTEYNLDAPSYLSGQMIINSKAWRKDKITEKVIDVIKKYRVNDMIALNVVCQGKIKELDCNWNVPCGYMDIEGNITEEKLKHMVYDNPKLYHAHGGRKWWNCSKIYAKNLYEKYLTKL